MTAWHPDTEPALNQAAEKGLLSPGKVKFTKTLAAIVAVLALVEITSGVLQGYYTPLLTDIARNYDRHDADVNWLEAAQLMFSALAVPILSKLGDLYGHRKILIFATVLTLITTAAMAFAPSFWTFLAAWALQGAYAVWLPLEVALIYLAARASAQHSGAEVPAITRKAAGILVAALETGVIVGALSAGMLIASFSLSVTLVVPAVVVALCLIAVIIWVPRDEVTERGRGDVDFGGVALLTMVLGSLMAGLVLVRETGVASVWPWLLIALAVGLLVPFVRHERQHPEPIIDVDLLMERSMWPIQLTAGLFGVSVLGAQAPLSTFARTNPEEVGYGLGLTAGQASYIIGLYVATMAIGALLYVPVSRKFTPRIALFGASILVGVGYLMFLPFHGTLLNAMINMAIAGLGSGALVAALPSAAAAAAPVNRTGMATGLTNTTKTIGGSIASAVFGVALFAGVSETALAAGETAAPLSGYLTVWGLCGVTALICALLLTRVPKDAFMASRLEEDPAS